MWPPKARRLQGKGINPAAPAGHGFGSARMFMEQADLAAERFFCFFEELIEEKPLLAVFAFFLLALSARLLLAPFDTVRDDGAEYVMKALEIVRGDFSPLDFHPLGWPLFLAPFLWLFGSGDLLHNLFVAKLATILVSALSIAPFFLIVRSVLGGKARVIALFMFVSFPLLVKWAGAPSAEPLFLLFLLFSLYFMVKSLEDSRYILAASAFAALTYLVRQNGFATLLLVLVFFLISSNKMPKADIAKYFVGIIAVFFIVCAPFMLQRYAEYGSPFSFTLVDNIFAEKWQFFDYAFPNVSFSEFIATHSAGDLFSRYIMDGLFRGISNSFRQMQVIALASLFFLYGVAARGLERRFLPFSLNIAIVLLTLSAVYSIANGGTRYMVPLVPSFIIFISAAIPLIAGQGSSTESERLSGQTPSVTLEKTLAWAGDGFFGKALQWLFSEKGMFLSLSAISIFSVIFFFAINRAYLAFLSAPFALLFSGMAFASFRLEKRHRSFLAFALMALCVSISFGFAYADNHYLRETGKSLPPWTDWAAANIKGKIAAPDWYNIMAHFSDSSMGLAWKRAQARAYSPDANVSVIPRSGFPDSTSARAWYKGHGVTHIVVLRNDIGGKEKTGDIFIDAADAAETPYSTYLGYLEDIYYEKEPEFYEKIYDDPSDSGVKIFRIK
ncbi:Dolichyl-phosphate-mannose-protein mannosyltransferase [uncultured archaeon]|nr:Dolichyl-phosphate-mannose-protein mannosyltransferase [uncultured archaeon]